MVRGIDFGPVEVARATVTLSRAKFVPEINGAEVEALPPIEVRSAITV